MSGLRAGGHCGRMPQGANVFASVVPPSLAGKGVRGLGMDFSLTAEQRRIQQTARAFAREELAPLAREADEQRAFPRELIPRMAKLGFLSGTVAREYGGAGMDALSFALVSEELGWADSSVRGFMTVHVSLVSGCIE